MLITKMLILVMSVKRMSPDLINLGDEGTTYIIDYKGCKVQVVVP